MNAQQFFTADKHPITIVDEMPAGEQDSQRPRFMSIRETSRTGLLPEALLRRMVKQGKVPGVYSGKRFLVNYDRLCDCLNDMSFEVMNEE